MACAKCKWEWERTTCRLNFGCFFAETKRATKRATRRERRKKEKKTHECFQFKHERNKHSTHSANSHIHFMALLLNTMAHKWGVSIYVYIDCKTSILNWIVVSEASILRSSICLAFVLFSFVSVSAGFFFVHYFSSQDFLKWKVEMQ